MRAQMLMDALMLFLSISAVLVFLTVFQPQNALTAQAVRYESQQHQLGLVSVLNSFVSFDNDPGPASEPVNGRVIDLLAYQQCASSLGLTVLDWDVLREAVKTQQLNVINHPGRHYIFATSLPGDFKVFDDVSSICLDAISLANIDIPTSCGTVVNVRYGTWPAARPVPRCP